MIKIIRKYQSNQVTFGELQIKNFKCYTLELPDRDNQKNISRIKEGKYNARIDPETSYNISVIRLEDKNRRTNVLFHPGNSTKDTEGCIIPGLEIDFVSKKVWKSRAALKKIISNVDQEKFRVEIINKFKKGVKKWNG